MTDLAVKLVQPFRFPLIHIFLLLIAAAFLAGSFSTRAELGLNTERKALMQDSEYFKTVITRFKTSYQALPGDMSNASSFWQSCRHDIADCNGNGDGVITTSASDVTTEAALAWRHLSISELLAEKYSGDLIGGYYVPSENIPQAPYKDSGYLLSNSLTYHNAASTNAHFLTVGGTSGWRFDNPVVVLADALAIDHKLDDGIASTGTIMAYSNEEQQCLENYGREILVGKKVSHYATHLSPEARCNLYMRVN